MSAEENKAILQRAVASFNDPEDHRVYFDLYAPDCVLHGYPPGLPSGL